MISPTAELLFSDDDLAVVNKPSGLSVLADRSGATCLWDQLPDLLGGKPYQVHRIDKGTSGVLLIARNADTQKRLTVAFHERRVRKFYLAWVVGSVSQASTINLPLRRGRKSRFRVAGQRSDIIRENGIWRLQGSVDPQGLSAATRVRPLLYAADRSLLMLQPHTGRSHQLRVHLSWIGHPILGDSLYGKPGDSAQQAQRLQLHCHRLVVPGIGSFCCRQVDDWLTG